MIWRPWFVAAALIVAFVTNAVLFASENMLPPDKTTNASVVATDRLVANMYWVADDRRQNFELMGMPPDLADRAVAVAKKMKKERGEAFRSVLNNQEDLLAAALCKTASPPTRYSAMSVLVIPDGNARRVLEPMEISELEGQDWYASGHVRDVYQKLEIADEASYHPDATYMGIAAILLAEEDKVIAQEYPWGTGTLSSRWSLTGMMDTYNGKKIDDRMVKYFATMHVFAELANEDGGICNH